MIDPIDAFLAAYPSGVQAISQTLRQMVRDAMPQEAHEVLFNSHNLIGYSLTGAWRDRIIYICPMRRYARLGFLFGAELPDPEQVLVGGGRRMRHVKVHGTEDHCFPALRSLVIAAWEHASMHRNHR